MVRFHKSLEPKFLKKGQRICTVAFTAGSYEIKIGGEKNCTETSLLSEAVLASTL